VVDFTFRAYSSLHTWDQYQLATTVPNLKCLLIEDTGKVWPAADLKVGILAASRQLKRQAAAVSDELLLNVPSPTLDLLTELVSVETARTKYQHGPAAKHRSAEIVALNRQFLRSALESLPLSIPFIDSTISVEWIRLPELWSSSHLAFDLAQSGVAVLPGAQFFWDDPAKGERWIRVALMRDPSTFKDGVIALASSIQIYSRRKGFSS
jgi:aspartate/methionine/tyrosine aminotransferase